MTATALSYLAAVGERATTPGLRPDVYGGIAIPRTEHSEPQREYIVSRTSLLGELERVGVEPVAVLPLEWWRRMIAESVLVDVPFASGARVDVRWDRKLIGEMAHAGSLLLFVALAALALLTVVAAGVAYTLSGLYAAVAVGVVSAVVGSILPALLPEFAWEWGVRRAVRRHLSDPMRVRDLLRGSIATGPGLPFRLPEPPADVATILRRLADADVSLGTTTIRVAAHPDAFSVSPPLTELLVGAALERVALDAEERRRLAADPIVYVRSGSAVAIVAQYGDFPIERELIDRVAGQGL